MSTKKRIFIISMIYLGVSLFYFAVLAIGSASFFADAVYARTYTYSLFFPIYCVICGIFTRILSCKLGVLILSMGLNLSQLVLSLYKFRWIYELNYGVGNLGFSYVLVSYVLLLLGYVIAALLIWMVHRIRARKVVKAIAQKHHTQKSINNPLFLKVYNKRTNRNEKYLVWITKAGKYMSSEPIIYYDPVELLAVDSSRNVYAFMSQPDKIKMKEYLELAK